MTVRLANFILANIEPILVEWGAFARSIWPPGAPASPAEVRDDAEDILRGTAADLQSDQRERSSPFSCRSELLSVRAR